MCRVFKKIVLYSALLWVQGFPIVAWANPEGGQVSMGAASIIDSANRVDIVQESSRAVFDWRGFDINAGETTQFHLPNSDAISLNRINSQSASSIQGSLISNGNLILINPNGIVFGKDSTVDVSRLIATTSGISSDRFMSGSLDFSIPGNPGGSIINEGRITAKEAGLVGLVAPRVINRGVIRAKLGKVQLASGDSFSVDLYGDGLYGIKVSDAVGSQLISNTGTLSAAGGTIALTAAAGSQIVDSLINVSGTLQAPTISQHEGRIVITGEGSNAVADNTASLKGQKSGKSQIVITSASLDVSGKAMGEKGGLIQATADDITIDGRSILDASGWAGGGAVYIGGDFHGEGFIPTARWTFVSPEVTIDVSSLGLGNAGQAVVWADDNTFFRGSIFARGGPLGGDGGLVEVSGKRYLLYRGFVDTLAPLGKTGSLLLDPTDIVILSGSGDGNDNDASTNSVAGSPSGVVGTVASADTAPTQIYESELEGIASTTAISLTASNSITMNDLADNLLSLDQNTTFSAGAGGFNMNAGDTIQSTGSISIVTTGGASTIGSLAGNGAKTLNIGGTATLSGTISGTGALTKSGAGTLTMPTANTYTGTTTLSAGTLAVGNNSSLGTGTFALSGGTFMGSGSALTFANPLTLGASAIIGGTSALTFNGVTTNANTTTLTVNNTALTTFAGPVNLSNSATSRTLTIAGTGNVAIPSVIQNGSTSTLSRITKSSTGTLTLSGANTYAGGTTLSAGTLVVGNNAALGTGALTFTAGTIQGNGTPLILQNILSGAGTMTIGGTSALTFNGALTLTASRSLAINNTALTTFAGPVNLSSSAANNTLTVSGTGNATISGVIANGGTSTASALTKTSTGTLTLSGANTYAGATTTSAGTLVATNNSSLGTGTFVLSGGTFSGSGSALTFANPVTLGASATIGGSTALTFNGVTTNANTTTLTVNNTALTTFANTVNLSNAATNRVLTIAGTGNVSIPGVIQNGSTSTLSGLSKSGSGTLTLSGANTYGGTTTLSAGTLTLGHNSALGTGALSLTAGTIQGNGTPLILQNALNGTGNWTIGGASDITFAGALTLTGSRTMTLTNTGATNFAGGVNLSNTATSYALTVAGAGSATVSGTIRNGGTATASALTKTGTGTLTLSGSNTYGGATTLTAGTTVAGSNTAFGTGTLSLNGGTLSSDGVARTFSNAVTFAASSTFGGSSALTFNGVATNANTTTLTVNNTAPTTFANTLNLSNTATSRTLTVGGTGAMTVSGVIQNGSTSTAGAIVKTGTGTLALTGSNTYAGGTTVTSGTLVAGTNTAVGTGTLTLNGGTFTGNGSAITLSNATTLAVSSGIAGSSALTFNGALTNNTNNTLTVNNAGLTTFAGTVNLSNSATSRTLTVDGTGATTVSGIIQNGSTSTASALTKTGTGTLTLSGNNTYAGATTVNGGTLKLGAANRISNSSAVTVGASGTWDLNGFSETVASITSAGAVTMGTGNTLTTTGAQTYTGAITGGTVGLTSTGAGAITANNVANDFTGALSLSTTAAASVVDANSLTLGTVGASTLTARTLNGDLRLTGQVTATATSGTSILLTASDRFINSVGASALQRSGTARYWVFSNDSTADTRGSLVGFNRYGCIYSGGTAVGAAGTDIPATGSGFFFAQAPVLTVGGLTVSDKIYDGTTSATLSGTPILNGILNSDAVSLNTSGLAVSFADKNVGASKSVEVSGFALNGLQVGYLFEQPAITASITPREILASGLTVADKTYDGTTSATISGSASVMGLGLDDVSVVGTASASFVDKNVGSAKATVVDGLSLVGADAANYTIGSLDSLTAAITPRSVAVGNLSVADKTYDGTRAATFTATPTVTPLLGDTLTLSGSYTALFDTKNVGSSKSVALSGFALAGTDAGNYTLATLPTLTASITPYDIAIGGLTASDKVYDSTRTAALAGTPTLAKFGSDSLTVSGTAGALFDTKDVGGSKSVTLSGLTLAGTDAANYHLLPLPTLTASITPYDIAIGGLSASDKVYDSTRTAALTGTPTLSALGSDDLSISGTATALFDTKNVGTAKSVALSGLTLAGTDAANYHLLPLPTLTATITPYDIAIGGLTASEKVYDATRTAALTGTPTLSALGSDDLSISGTATALFDSKNVGASKSVALSGLTLAGTDAANYHLLPLPTLTASITPYDIAIGGLSALDKVYDGTTAATLTGTPTVSHLGADDLTIEGSAVASFADKNVAVSKPVNVSGFTFAGADAANYRQVPMASLSATITPRPLTMVSFTAHEKTFDNTPSASVRGYTFDNAVAGDDVVATGFSASFADALLGKDKTVTLSAAGLAGHDASNYQFTFSILTALADISLPDMGSLLSFNPNSTSSATPVGLNYSNSNPRDVKIVSKVKNFKRRVGNLRG